MEHMEHRSEGSNEREISNHTPSEAVNSPGNRPAAEAAEVRVACAAAAVRRMCGDSREARRFWVLRRGSMKEATLGNSHKYGV